METPTTICSKCKKELPESQDYFSVRAKSPLTFRKDCKDCVRKRSAKYRKENHEKVLESKRKYREDNHDIILKKAREYNSREDVKERNREYAKTERQRKKHAERNKKWASKPAVKAKRALQKEINTECWALSNLRPLSAKANVIRQ